MALDIRILWLISACCAFLPGLLVLLVRKTYPLHLRGVMLAFGVANICLGTGWMFRVERALVGEFAFQVLSNTLFISGAALMYLGICLLKRQDARMVWMIGLPLLQLVSGVWFTVSRRNMSLGVVSALLLLAVFLIVMAVTLQRKQDGERAFPDILAAISLGLMAAVYLGGAVVMVRNWQVTGEYDFNSPQVVISAIASAIMEGTLTTLFLLMVSARLQRELAVQAMIDPLTELYNRRAFEEIARREVAGAARAGTPLSLIVVDLDHFKQINDEHGHHAGDAMLRHVAMTLRSKLREEDFVCRWGGDEFCVLLPRCR